MSDDKKEPLIKIKPISWELRKHREKPEPEKGSKLDRAIINLYNVLGTKSSAPPKNIAQREPEKKCLGVLFAEEAMQGNLKYFSLTDDNIYRLDSGLQDVSAIMATDDNVYCGGIWGARGLFDHTEVVHGTNMIHSLAEHKGRILLGTEIGLYDIDVKEPLIMGGDMKAKKINLIKALCVDSEDNLYALVSYDSHNHAFRKIYEKDDRYSIGAVLREYRPPHTSVCEADIIPDVWPDDTEPFVFAEKDRRDGYAFSVISCTYQSILDINGKAVLGIETSGNQKITSTKVLSTSGNEVHVAYSGLNMDTIMVAKIDVKNRRALDNFNLSDKIDMTAEALEPVRSFRLHEKLLKTGKKLK